MNSIYDIALALARDAHEGQKRRDGKDYITHPIAVAEKVPTEYAKCLALIHDAVEDQPTPEKQEAMKERIRAELGESLLADCLHLTKREGEAYYDYVMRVVHSGRHDVMLVKLADLQHNLSDSEPGHRKDKYQLARHILLEAVRE